MVNSSHVVELLFKKGVSKSKLNPAPCSTNNKKYEKKKSDNPKHRFRSRKPPKNPRELVPRHQPVQVISPRQSKVQIILQPKFSPRTPKEHHRSKSAEPKNSICKTRSGKGFNCTPRLLSRSKFVLSSRQAGSHSSLLVNTSTQAIRSPRYRQQSPIALRNDRIEQFFLKSGDARHFLRFKANEFKSKIKINEKNVTKREGTFQNRKARSKSMDRRWEASTSTVNLLASPSRSRNMGMRRHSRNVCDKRRVSSKTLEDESELNLYYENNKCFEDRNSDIYRKVLGPTPDETILAGLQTVIDMCSVAETGLKPYSSSSNLLTQNQTVMEWVESEYSTLDQDQRSTHSYASLENIRQRRETLHEIAKLVKKKKTLDEIAHCIKGREDVKSVYLARIHNEGKGDEDNARTQSGSGTSTRSTLSTCDAVQKNMFTQPISSSTFVQTSTTFDSSTEKRSTYPDIRQDLIQPSLRRHAELIGHESGRSKPTPIAEPKAFQTSLEYYPSSGSSKSLDSKSVQTSLEPLFSERSIQTSPYDYPSSSMIDTSFTSKSAQTSIEPLITHIAVQTSACDHSHSKPNPSTRKSLDTTNQSLQSPFDQHLPNRAIQTSVEILECTNRSVQTVSPIISSNEPSQGTAETREPYLRSMHTQTHLSIAKASKSLQTLSDMESTILLEPCSNCGYEATIQYDGKKETTPSHVKVGTQKPFTERLESIQEETSTPALSRDPSKQTVDTETITEPPASHHTILLDEPLSDDLHKVSYIISVADNIPKINKVVLANNVDENIGSKTYIRYSEDVSTYESDSEQYPTENISNARYSKRNVSESDTNISKRELPPETFRESSYHAYAAPTQMRPYSESEMSDIRCTERALNKRDNSPHRETLIRSPPKFLNQESDFRNERQYSEVQSIRSPPKPSKKMVTSHEGLDEDMNEDSSMHPSRNTKRIPSSYETNTDRIKTDESSKRAIFYQDVYVNRVEARQDRHESPLKAQNRTDGSEEMSYKSHKAYDGESNTWSHSKESCMQTLSKEGDSTEPSGKIDKGGIRFSAKFSTLPKQEKDADHREESERHEKLKHKDSDRSPPRISPRTSVLFETDKADEAHRGKFGICNRNTDKKIFYQESGNMPSKIPIHVSYRNEENEEEEARFQEESTEHLRNQYVRAHTKESNSRSPSRSSNLPRRDNYNENAEKGFNRDYREIRNDRYPSRISAQASSASSRKYKEGDDYCGEYKEFLKGLNSRNCNEESRVPTQTNTLFRKGMPREDYFERPEGALKIIDRNSHQIETNKRSPIMNSVKTSVSFKKGNEEGECLRKSGDNAVRRENNIKPVLSKKYKGQENYSEKAEKSLKKINQENSVRSPTRSPAVPRNNKRESYRVLFDEPLERFADVVYNEDGTVEFVPVPLKRGNVGKDYVNEPKKGYRERSSFRSPPRIPAGKSTDMDDNGYCQEDRRDTPPPRNTEGQDYYEGSRENLNQIGNNSYNEQRETESPSRIPAQRYTMPHTNKTKEEPQWPMRKTVIGSYVENTSGQTSAMATMNDGKPSRQPSSESQSELSQELLINDSQIRSPSRTSEMPPIPESGILQNQNSFENAVTGGSLSKFNRSPSSSGESETNLSKGKNPRRCSMTRSPLRSSMKVRDGSLRSVRSRNKSVTIRGNRGNLMSQLYVAPNGTKRPSITDTVFEDNGSFQVPNVESRLSDDDNISWVSSIQQFEYDSKTNLPLETEREPSHDESRRFHKISAISSSLQPIIETPLSETFMEDTTEDEIMIASTLEPSTRSSQRPSDESQHSQDDYSSVDSPNRNAERNESVREICQVDIPPAEPYSRRTVDELKSTSVSSYPSVKVVSSKSGKLRTQRKDKARPKDKKKSSHRITRHPNKCTCGSSECECFKSLQALEVRYATVRITKFELYSTFEILSSTKRKPQFIPSNIESIFVVKNK